MTIRFKHVMVMVADMDNSPLLWWSGPGPNQKPDVVEFRWGTPRSHYTFSRKTCCRWFAYFELTSIISSAASPD